MGGEFSVNKTKLNAKEKRANGCINFLTFSEITFGKSAAIDPAKSSHALDGRRKKASDEFPIAYSCSIKPMLINISNINTAFRNSFFVKISTNGKNR